MNIFTFLINRLKKWWMDESSPRYLRGFLQMTKLGLHLPIRLVYNEYNALGMQTRPNKAFFGFGTCLTGLSVSETALSRRDKKIARLNEQGASKRRIGLYLARWLGWASLIIYAVSYADTPCNQSLVGTFDSINNAAYTSCGKPGAGTTIEVLTLHIATLDNRKIKITHQPSHQLTNPSLSPSLLQKIYNPKQTNTRLYANHSITSCINIPLTGTNVDSISFLPNAHICGYSQNLDTCEYVMATATTNGDKYGPFLDPKFSTGVSTANGCTPPNVVPSITGFTSNQNVNDKATIAPFNTVILNDSDDPNLSVTLALDDDTKGTLSDLTIASDAIATVQAALQAITFTQTANRVAVGSTETTTFTIKVNDGTGDTTNNATTVVSTSINDAPTDIALSNSSVKTSDGTNATIGTLSTTDVDKSESFTYSLVSGTGDTDNASFNIDGTTLRANDTSA